MIVVVPFPMLFVALLVTLLAVLLPLMPGLDVHVVPSFAPEASGER
jgi:hypothetical protein